MKFKRGLGIFLFLIGIFILISSQSGMTGNVVSDRVSAVSSILGLVFIIGGMVFMSFGDKPEYVRRDLGDILLDQPDPIGKERVVVLDTSGIIEFKEDMGRVLKRFPDKVFVPKEIMKEIKNDYKLNKLFEGKVQVVKAGNYKNWGKIAKEYLEQTPKHQKYLAITEMLDNKKGFTRNFFSAYKNDIINIKQKLESQKDKKRHVFNEENLRWFLNKDYKVSNGDIDALGTALYEAGKDKKVVDLLAEDVHLRDAITSIKKKYTRVGKNLNYIHCRNYEKRVA